MGKDLSEMTLEELCLYGRKDGFYLRMDGGSTKGIRRPVLTDLRRGNRDFMMSEEQMSNESFTTSEDVL